MKGIKGLVGFVLIAVLITSLSTTVFAGGHHRSRKVKTIVAPVSVSYADDTWVCPYNEDCPYGENCIANGGCQYKVYYRRGIHCGRYC